MQSRRSERFDFLLLRFFNLLILKRILGKVAVVVVKLWLSGSYKNVRIEITVHERLVKFRTVI